MSTNVHPTISSDHVKCHPHLLRKAIVMLMPLIGYGTCYRMIALVRKSKPKCFKYRILPCKVPRWMDARSI